MRDISTMVARRVQEAQNLVTRARQQADELSVALGPHLGGRAGLTTDNIRSLILSQAEYLESLTDQMREAEEAYVSEQDDDISLRGRLAEASIELDRKLRLTRAHIRDSEGADALQIYGLVDTPPRARGALVDYARNAIDLMSAHPYTFRGELGEILETRTVAVLLKDLLEPFEALVERMNTEVDELQEALSERNVAMDDWVNAYRGVARTLEGFCWLSGKFDLAEEYHPNFERTPTSLNLAELTSSEAEDDEDDE